MHEPSLAAVTESVGQQTANAEIQQRCATEIQQAREIGARLEAVRKQHESSPEEIAGLARLHGLYTKLSEAERYYIVARRDDKQEPGPTNERQNYKNDALTGARRRKVWIVIACVPAFFLLWWVCGILQRDAVRDANAFVLDYLREHSQHNQALKSAIETADQKYQEHLVDQRSEREEQ